MYMIVTLMGKIYNYISCKKISIENNMRVDVIELTGYDLWCLTSHAN